MHGSGFYAHRGCDGGVAGDALAFVTVAKLHLPQQDIGGEDNLAQMDAISMTPWRCTEDHRPLGNIQRARKEVYRRSSLLRHQLNHQVRKEPKSLAEVFGL